MKPARPCRARSCWKSILRAIGRFAPGISLQLAASTDAGRPRSLLFRFLRPGVFEGNGAIQHRLAWRAVRIEDEVAESLELIAFLGPRVLEAGFGFRHHDLEALRVQRGFEITTVLLRLRFGKEPL